jgi:hypothetical protein
VDEEEVFEQLKKCSRLNLARYGLNDRRVRSVLVGALLVFAVVLSASSGVYAGASFFPEDNVTMTVYSTTTSWITSTVWSTVTSTVQGVLTTVTYTTSTSTIYVTASTTSTRIGTVITITKAWGGVGSLLVSGYLKDAYGNGLQGMPVKVYVDGRYLTTVSTFSGGSFTYNAIGPSNKGIHTVTVTFNGNSNYAPSTASASYRL